MKILLSLVCTYFNLILVSLSSVHAYGYKYQNNPYSGECRLQLNLPGFGDNLPPMRYGSPHPKLGHPTATLSYVPRRNPPPPVRQSSPVNRPPPPPKRYPPPPPKRYPAPPPVPANPRYNGNRVTERPRLPPPPVNNFIRDQSLNSLTNYNRSPVNNLGGNRSPPRPVYNENRPPPRPIFNENLPPPRPVYNENRPPPRPVLTDNLPPPRPVYTENRPSARPVLTDNLPPPRPVYNDNRPPPRPVLTDNLLPARPIPPPRRNYNANRPQPNISRPRPVQPLPPLPPPPREIPYVPPTTTYSQPADEYIPSTQGTYSGRQPVVPVGSPVGSDLGVPDAYDGVSDVYDSRKKYDDRFEENPVLNYDDNVAGYDEGVGVSNGNYPGIGQGFLPGDVDSGGNFVGGGDIESGNEFLSEDDRFNEVYKKK